MNRTTFPTRGYQPSSRNDRIIGTANAVPTSLMTTQQPMPNAFTSHDTQRRRHQDRLQCRTHQQPDCDDAPCQSQDAPVLRRKDSGTSSIHTSGVTWSGFPDTSPPPQHVETSPYRHISYAAERLRQASRQRGWGAKGSNSNGLNSCGGPCPSVDPDQRQDPVCASRRAS